MSVVKISIKSRYEMRGVDGPDAWAVMRNVFPEAPDKLEDYYGQDVARVVQVDDLGELPDIILNNIQISPIKRLQITRLKNDMNDRSISMPEIIQDVKQSVQIHVPGPELSSFTEVDWLENACTEELQRRLNERWRILAVLPQPGNRRPDYVIGRRP